MFVAHDLGADEHRPGFPRGRFQLVLAVPGPVTAEGAIGIRLSDEGITTIRYGCGGETPYEQMTRGLAPRFLLPPIAK